MKAIPFHATSTQDHFRAVFIHQPCLPGQVASAQPMWGSLIFFALCWYLTYLRVKMAQQLKGKSVKGPYRSLKKLC